MQAALPGLLQTWQRFGEIQHQVLAARQTCMYIITCCAAQITPPLTYGPRVLPRRPGCNLESASTASPDRQLEDRPLGMGGWDALGVQALGQAWADIPWSVFSQQGEYGSGVCLA